MKISVLPSLLLTLFCLSSGLPAKNPPKPKAPAKATPAPKREGKPAAPAPAHLRIWKEAFTTDGDLRVQIVPDAAKNDPVIRDLEPKGFRFTNYFPLPAGPAAVTLNLPDQPGIKPQSFPQKFAAGSYATLLVRRDGDGYALEVIDDSSPDGKANADGAELTVRNFIPELTQFSVQVGEEISSRMRGADGFLHVRGLERQAFSIETSTVSATGKEAKWRNEVDFRTARKATLLIFVDPYGRMRPRVVFDGVATRGIAAPPAEPASAEPAPAEETAPPEKAPAAENDSAPAEEPPAQKPEGE